MQYETENGNDEITLKTLNPILVVSVLYHRLKY